MAAYNTPPPSHTFGCGPEDFYTAANVGMWATLKDAAMAWIIIEIGTPAGGAAAVTLDQATALAGTGTKTLGFDKYYQGGQRLVIGSTAAAFVIGETVTGDSSGNTAKVIKISSDELVVTPITGSTTWTTGETLTGASASATITGTGTDEDIWCEMTAASDTFSTLAVTFTKYAIPVWPNMLDEANDFDCFQVDIAKAASGSTVGSCCYIFEDKIKKYPGISHIGANKAS